MRKRSKRRLYRAFSGLLIAVTVLSLLAYAMQRLSTSPLPLRAVDTNSHAGSLRLMSSFGPAFAGEMIATRLGLFERAGLHLELHAGKDTGDPIASVVDGTDTFGHTRADSFLVARSKGAPLVAFAAGFAESPAAFYALKKSGIWGPQDFPGHRIGRRVGDDTAIIYDALVARFGLPSSRITEAPVTSDLSPFLQGHLDVWPGHVGTDDYALDQAGADYVVISPGGYGIHLLGSVYFTSSRTVAEQPQLVRRFLAGLIAGWQSVYDDEATSIPVLASFDEPALSAAYVRYALDRQRQYLRPIDARFGEFNDLRWRALETILRSQRLLDTSADLPTAINYQFLQDTYRKPLKFGE